MNDEQPLRYVDLEGEIREVSAAVLNNLDSYIPSSEDTEA